MAKIDLKDTSFTITVWKVPPFSLERYSVRVPLPTIWYGKCPQGFHQKAKTCGRPVKESFRLTVYLDDILLMASTEGTLTYLNSHPSQIGRRFGEYLFIYLFASILQIIFKTNNNNVAVGAGNSKPYGALR